MQSFIQKNRILLIHLSFWCLYFSFLYYQISFTRHGEDVNYSKAFFDASTHILMMATLSYLNYFFLLPRFLIHKNLLKYLFEFIIPFGVIVTLHIYLKRYIYADLSESKRFLYSTKFVLQHAIITLFIAIFVGMLKFAEDWLALEGKRKELENEKLTAELTFLKAQINPHFLFNTLNSLSSLVITGKSKQAEEMIQNLSNFYRTSLNSDPLEDVTLAEEVDLQRLYLDIEAVRYPKRLRTVIQIAPELMNQHVPALILQPLVENAIKYGVSRSSKPVTIEIKATAADTMMVISVTDNGGAFADSKDGGNGIGLANVRDRLEARYRSAATLDTCASPAGGFVATLRLPLSHRKTS